MEDDQQTLDELVTQLAKIIAAEIRSYVGKELIDLTDSHTPAELSEIQT